MCCVCLNNSSRAELYTLSLHDALPILERRRVDPVAVDVGAVQAALVLDRELAVAGEQHGVVAGDGHVRSEEHTSELQSHVKLVCRLLLEKKNCTSASLPASSDLTTVWP